MSNPNITRQILTEIERDPSISQKRMSEEIGISVGMINWHVKRCVTKGLIKLKQAPAHRYLYYLTPDGFTEKAKLTATYLQASFNIFQKGRDQYHSLLTKCHTNKWTNIILYGHTELTDLAILVTGQFSDFHIVGIIDEKKTQKKHAGTSIFISFSEFRNSEETSDINAIILCDYYVPELQNEKILTFLNEIKLDQTRLLIPDFLK